MSSTGETTQKMAGLFDKAVDGVHRTRTILKDPPLTVLGLNVRQQPMIPETVQQARVLCEDYIYNRLELVAQADREKGTGMDAPPPPLPTVTEVSREIQLIGARLESNYPTLYQNISRQVNVPLKSEAAVRKVMLSIGDFMFKHSVVTWGRVVALFAISSGVATDCVHSGHPELILTVVSLFSEIVEKHVAVWICKQGGWVEVMKAFRENKATRALWALIGLGLVIGFCFAWLTAAQI